MQKPSIGLLLFAAASAVLALHPVIWLLRTWQDPSYDSDGYLFLLTGVGLAVWSITSGRPQTSKHHQGQPIALLLFSGLIRFFSQIMAINFLGGIALAIDAYAVLKVLKTDARPRAVSPFWLAALFLLSLPVERLLQRFAGLVLQDASAFGACRTLGLFFDDLQCAGTLLTLQGHEILVDLPCSGTSSLMIIIGTLVVFCAIYRPRPATAIFWFGLSFALSVIFNSLRITLLSLGVTYRAMLPFDVMSEPIHGIIGLFTLGLSLIPLFLWFHPKAWDRKPLWHFTVPPLPAGYGIVTGGVTLAVAFAIVMAPRTAWDVSATVQPPVLPTRLAGNEILNHALSPQEVGYFQTYGGVARKASYGAFGITVVKTTSPLRHLHSPEECLKGLGYKVRFLGTQHGVWPSSVYSAENANGRWQVLVSFAADDGFVSANMSAVIWHWLKNPGIVWSSYQRITPLNFGESARQKLDTALMTSLDVPKNPPLNSPRFTGENL